MRNFFSALLGAVLGALAVVGVVTADRSSVPPTVVPMVGVAPLNTQGLVGMMNGQEGYGQASITCSTNGNYGADRASGVSREGE
jgi:hypothetical protein